MNRFRSVASSRVLSVAGVSGVLVVAALVSPPDAVVADYSVPDLSATSGTLSIRAQATDAAGDTIDQTYYNDYSLTTR